MTTKEKILDLLRENTGSFLSGQEIADRIFVTRACVWKGIKSLQAEGYEIDGVTNKGYRLRRAADNVNISRVKAEIAFLYDFDLVYEKEVTSTNEVALSNIISTGKDTVVIANCQTKGRGRRGRQFYSPRDTGLYLSIAIRNNNRIEDIYSVTAMAATAVATAVDEVLGEQKSQIKWVNDVLLNGHKVSGILCENYQSLEDPGSSIVIIGIGINVYEPQEGFPKEIREVAGSVFQGMVEGDRSVKTELTILVINNLFRYLAGGEGVRSDCYDIYRKKSFLIGNYIRINNYDGNNRYAYATDINEKYHLIVRYDNDEMGELSSGEVSVVKY